ncbi:hypothetical protein J4E86_000003 [Alternaria arbusti]|uniref:uncharacterized protein n=1 Tax=Alternaria arbusti TaxID=232088 RepID=UPI00221FE07B|nr:uncharacterized protein J4E86_000003 [Alternaria arbusti]KAI4960978.1 hypothetical protein J4E86_000003 [Alternaria arbusti]
MTAIQDYQYRPLVEDDNSRFIQLYPAAQFDDPIHVDLVERAYDASNTDGPTGYEALSYTWGTDLDSAYIFVAQDSRLLVRRNVTQILGYLRDEPGHDLQAFKVGPPNKYFFTGEDDDITRAMKFLETGWFTRRWVKYYRSSNG